MNDLDIEKINRLEAEIARLNLRITELESSAGANPPQSADPNCTYDDLPLPVWVEDFSAVKARFDTLRAAGVANFRLYFEAHPEEVARCAALVKIETVNQANLRFFGLQSKAEFPRSLPLFFHENSPGVFCEEIIVLAEGGLRFDAELPILDLGHQERYILLNLEVAAGFEETLGRVLVTFMEVSQRYCAEEAVQNSNARLESMFNLTGIGIAVTDLNGKWVRWNHAFEQLLGYSKEEMISVGNMAMMHPDDRQKTIELHHALLAGENPAYRMEKRYIHKDGSTVWVDLSVIPIKNANGEITTVLGAGIDITERMRTGEALRESEATLRAIFENSNDAIAVFYQETPVLGNQACVDMFGYSLEELLTKKVIELIAPSYRAAILETNIRRAAGEDLPLSYETRGLRKDGTEFDLDVRVSMYRLHGEVYNLSILRDISSRKQAEEILRQDELRLRRAEQIANIGSWELDMTSGKSHWSEQFYRICGYAPDAFEPTPEICEGLIYSKDKERAAAVLAKALKGSGRYTVEKRFVRSDGTPIWVESHGMIEFDSQRKPIKITRTILDITERKKAEEALRKSEDLFHQLADNVREVLWVQNYHTRAIEYINPAYEEVWGQTCQSLYDRPESMAETVHPEDRERVVSALRMQYEGQLFNLESRIIRPDGETSWIGARSYVINDSAGRPYRLIGMAEDITERKLKEQIGEIEGRRLNSLLTISQKAFSSVQELMDNAIEEVALLTASPYGFVYYYDHPTMTFTYHSINRQAKIDSESLTLPLSFWMEEGGLGRRVINERDRVIINDLAASPHAPERVPPGHILLSRYIILPVIKNGQLYAVAGVANKASDYTELDADQTDLMLQEVVKMIDRRISADQLEASLNEKNALLKEIHHRVKNNMQVMISLIQMQAIQIQDESTRDMLFECKDRIYSMALVHEQLYGSTNLSHIRFGEYLERLAYDLYSAYNVGIGVRLDLQAQPVTLPIETAIPCGLLLNEMITNSFKHAFPNGRKGTVRVRLGEDSGEIVLTVSDDGIGIPESIHPERTDSLGLKLIHLLARQVDGKLALDRENGTTYTLRLKTA